MRKSNNKISISLKTIILSFFFLVIIAMLIFSLWLPITFYSSQFSKQSQTNCKDLLLQTNKSLSQSLDSFNQKIENIQSDSTIQSLISNIHYYTSPQNKYQMIISKYFSPQSMDAYYLQSLDLYIKGSGQHLFYGTETVELTTPFNSKYYEHALIYPTELNWIGYDTFSKCIEISKLVYNESTYEVEALFIISISNNFLLDQFNSYNMLSLEQLYIVDSSQTIICSNNISELGSTFDFSSNKDDPLDNIQSSNPWVLTAPFKSINASFPYTSWTSIIMLDKNTLLNDFYQLVKEFYVLTFIIFFLCILFALYFSKLISTPIANLVAAMKQVEKEDLTISLLLCNKITEINSINSSFNKMTSKLNSLINNEYKIRLIEQEVQLKNLKSQIKPHFLFNTLQLISWKAHDYEAYPVCEMIHSLSFMLETDLYSTKNDVYTLREEIEYIKQYAKIIYWKYDEKIMIHLDVPDDLLGCIIPKLTIQPFLENAVIHGLSQKTAPGLVSIVIRNLESVMTISICDDGIGIRPNILQVLRNEIKIDESSIETSQGHHIALANIQKRIKLLYGNEFGFSIESQLNIGTSVTIRLPINKED